MISELNSVLKEIIDGSDRPIVIYSAMWPLSIAMRMPVDELSITITDMLVSNLKGNQTLLMPTFTHGYGCKVCNLDTEKSTTGILTEVFRKTSGAKRTRSAFFSFAALGKHAKFATSTNVESAWGDGSLYEWFHLADAQIITIGTHPTHCSFTHRAEWLSRDIISYRFEKKFIGKIILDSIEYDQEENLYVRGADPIPVNDWTWLEEEFINCGMKVRELKGVKFTSMSARQKMEIILPHISLDPYCLLKNKSDFMKG